MPATIEGEGRVHAVAVKGEVSMKFSLFVHMERLDAGQSHKRALSTSTSSSARWPTAVACSAIWTGEHHGMDFTIAPNPFINLADLAAPHERMCGSAPAP